MMTGRETNGSQEGTISTHDILHRHTGYLKVLAIATPNQLALSRKNGAYDDEMP